MSDDAKQSKDGAQDGAEKQKPAEETAPKQEAAPKEDASPKKDEAPKKEKPSESKKSSQPKPSPREKTLEKRVAELEEQLAEREDDLKDARKALDFYEGLEEKLTAAEDKLSKIEAAAPDGGGWVKLSESKQEKMILRTYAKPIQNVGCLVQTVTEWTSRGTEVETDIVFVPKTKVDEIVVDGKCIGYDVKCNF